MRCWKLGRNLFFKDCNWDKPQSQKYCNYIGGGDSNIFPFHPKIGGNDSQFDFRFF